MALIWHDGFESYNDYSDVNLLPNCSASINVYFSTSYGRRSGQRGMKIQDETRYYKTNWSGNPQTAILGFAFRFLSNPVLSLQTGKEMFSLRYGDTVHLYIFVSGGLIRFYNSSLSLLATTSGHTINALTWYYLEVKVTISNTVGQITCKIDESEVLNTAANLDNCNGATEVVNSIVIRSQGVSSDNTYYDDLYICDTLGSKNNDFLGDIRIDPIRVNGAGTYSQLTPSAGNNEDNVDEIYGPDDDTTYNYGTTIGLKDSYALGALPSPAATTIYGVKSQVTVRKEDAGTKKCKILTRAGTTDDLGDEITLSDSYETHTELFEDNPADSAAWEDADVNGMEVGMEITV